MWNSIVSVPDLCLLIYFQLTSQSTTSLPWMTMLPFQMSFQSDARKFACMSFNISSFLFVWYGHKACWACCIVLVLLIALASPTVGKSGLVYVLSSMTELVPCLCLPIWLYAKGNMWFMMFTLSHHYSFITDKDLTHIWYTNLIIHFSPFITLLVIIRFWL